MRSAPEMKEITDKVIKEQSKSSNAVLEKIDAYIYEEANNGEYFCCISKRHELFEYMCEGLIRQRLNIAGYTIIPLYDINGEFCSYKIECK
jgi:hypothetical protein